MRNLVLILIIVSSAAVFWISTDGRPSNENESRFVTRCPRGINVCGIGLGQDVQDISHLLKPEYKLTSIRGSNNLIWSISGNSKPCHILITSNDERKVNSVFASGDYWTLYYRRIGLIAKGDSVSVLGDWARLIVSDKTMPRPILWTVLDEHACIQFEFFLKDENQVKTVRLSRTNEVKRAL